MGKRLNELAEKEVLTGEEEVYLSDENLDWRAKVKNLILPEFKEALDTASRVAKGVLGIGVIDELHTFDNVGVYALKSGTNPSTHIGVADRGILVVTATNNIGVQQFYFGGFNPNGWSGDAAWTKIYTRYHNGTSWSEWKDYLDSISETITTEITRLDTKINGINEATTRRIDGLVQELKSGIVLMASE